MSVLVSWYYMYQKLLMYEQTDSRCLGTCEDQREDMVKSARYQKEEEGGLPNAEWLTKCNCLSMINLLVWTLKHVPDKKCMRETK